MNHGYELDVQYIILVSNKIIMEITKNHRVAYDISKKFWGTSVNEMFNIPKLVKKFDKKNQKNKNLVISIVTENVNET